MEVGGGGGPILRHPWPDSRAGILENLAWPGPIGLTFLYALKFGLVPIFWPQFLKDFYLPVSFRLLSYLHYILNITLDGFYIVSYSNSSIETYRYITAGMSE